ncbi:hypothetical protein Taro_026102 [Colocasia esculenta]|uniref:DUF547 domain-containing protein n=1 Tax=Colocasia esculenta TaxID=4460 RepID=A0A843VQA7_COLES|nr:hypothetical protein [Colocasia esculenta]
MGAKGKFLMWGVLVGLQELYRIQIPASKLFECRSDDREAPRGPPSCRLSPPPLLNSSVPMLRFNPIQGKMDVMATAAPQTLRYGALQVQTLERLLSEELALHMILENAVEHVTGTLHDLSCVPHGAQELLSNITTLEAAVLKLEQEIVSLRFQLIQERNERRLAEYHLKKLTSCSLVSCSPGNEEMQDAVECGKPIKIKKASTQLHKMDLKMKKGISKGLWEYPNMLSEEMVRCMKDIFITLADVAGHPKSLFSGELQPSLSPNGHLLSSPCVLSEPSTVSPCGQSPQVDLQFNNRILDMDGSCDPYKFLGKVCWADIGNYRLATEVSWMSVGKSQLEFAAVALRKFRSLIEQLAKVNPIHLSGNEKLAFWINLYNALIMHAYLAYGVPKSDLKLFSLMQKVAYTVGGHSFSAITIEYVVLKMKPPIHRPQTALFLALHKLKVSEEQRKFSVDVPEPLVAFALSCGMYSSPAVKIFTPKNVREELQEAQRDFIRASVGVNNKGKLLVPKMIYSFARLSVDDANLATWLSHFLPPQQANFVERCISRRRQTLLGSRSCEILPFDSRFRYLFLPEILS